MSFKAVLKGQGHVTVNKPVISIRYIVAHSWPLSSPQILEDGVMTFCVTCFVIYKDIEKFNPSNGIEGETPFRV